MASFAEGDTSGMSLQEIHLMDQMWAATLDNSLTPEEKEKIWGEILERHEG